MVCCDIFEVLDVHSHKIKEYQHWLVALRKNHTKLGACIVMTKHHYKRFSDLPVEAFTEFSEVVKELETALKMSFKYDKINWLMLMMKDEHTHFHVFPRYKKPVQFGGVTWEDTGGNDPLVQEGGSVDSDILTMVMEELIMKMP